jgi:UDP-N-acetylglucosamine transferase subunit ALG13
MIFVTTGTQAPFNRLVKAMDDIAANLNGEEVIVQAFGVNFETKNIKVVGFLDPLEYTKIFDRSRLIVSHAGIGSILSALTKGKPIIVMPRNAELNEHRDNHQYDTTKNMSTLGYVPVAHDEVELREILTGMLETLKEDSKGVIGDYASVSLIDSIRTFILKD